jgi:hypothetical protein
MIEENLDFNKRRGFHDLIVSLRNTKAFSKE